MDARQELHEIDILFGEGWFSKCTELYPYLNSLPLEEQIDWVKNRSIHGSTYFFRDSTLYPVLEHLILANAPRKPVRVASVGCSDGREVYSTLIHFWKRRDELVVHGYDSNPELIRQAQAGGEGIARTSKGRRVSSAYSERSHNIEDWRPFGAEGEAYIIEQGEFDSREDLSFTEQARNRVAFRQHNIFEAHLPERYDVVLMLNVLCHYTRTGRDRILANVSSSLEDKGWLVCERIDPGSANAKKEYDNYMKDLSAQGFAKQKTVVPTWYSPRDNLTSLTRVYRKK